MIKSKERVNSKNELWRDYRESLGGNQGLKYHSAIALWSICLIQAVYGFEPAPAVPLPATEVSLLFAADSAVWAIGLMPSST